MSTGVGCDAGKEGGGKGGDIGRVTTAKSLQNEHAEALLVQLNEFRKNEQFTDVCLICGDGRIMAHRNILAAASPYFQAMFGGNFPESSQSEVHIHEMDSRCLELAVDFIYTGHLDNYVDCVQQLLETAAFLQLEHLLDLCTRYMCAQLDAHNCLGFKLFAEKQNNFPLLDSACQYIISHFKDVVLSEEFLEMTYHELNNILTNDALYVHSDDAVLCGLARWAEHRPTERISNLMPLLRYIHPACVTAETVRSLAVLKQNKESEKWVSDVLQSADTMEWQIFVLDKMGRTPDLQRFNLTFNEATALQPLPRPAFAVSLTAHKNILYAQGGSVGRSTRDCFYYNIYRDQWHKLHPLLMERSHHRSVVLNGCLYALGGNTLQGATCSVECLNLVTNKASFRENMLAKRNAMGAVVCENTLYVMGGETDHRSLYSVERFDPRVGQWHEMPVMHEVNSYCSSAAIGTQIYCCEGLGSCMERFDMRANRWEIINFWEEREFYEIFAVDNKLYSVSGETISRYEETENKWQCAFKFIETREWDTAIGLQMLNNILTNDALYVHSDDAVLCGLARWAEHRPTERISNLMPLLRYIHPACVTAETVRSLAVLKQNKESEKWVSDVLQSADTMEWQIFVLDKMGRTPDLQRFNLTFNEATALQPLPRPAFAVSLTAHKNILYAQGGSVGRSTRDCFYYNIYRDQWHKLHPLLMERSHHRSVVLNGCLYALGGNTLQGATCSVECLNLVTNKASFRENMLAKRNAMGAVVCENTLYVMGGETDHRSLYSVERFDPRVGQWHEMPVMHEVNSYCSSAAIGTQIYCCEGLGSCMERFDMRANRWEIINFWEEREFYEIFAVDNKLYSVSGETISRYEETENKWQCAFKFIETREWDTAIGLQMVSFLRV